MYLNEIQRKNNCYKKDTPMWKMVVKDKKLKDKIIRGNRKKIFVEHNSFFKKKKLS